MRYFRVGTCTRFRSFGDCAKVECPPLVHLPLTQPHLRNFCCSHMTHLILMKNTPYGVMKMQLTVFKLEILNIHFTIHCYVILYCRWL